MAGHETPSNRISNNVGSIKGAGSMIFSMGLGIMKATKDPVVARELAAKLTQRATELEKGGTAPAQPPAPAAQPAPAGSMEGLAAARSTTQPFGANPKQQTRTKSLKSLETGRLNIPSPTQLGAGGAGATARLGGR